MIEVSQKEWLEDIDGNYVMWARTSHTASLTFTPSTTYDIVLLKRVTRHAKHSGTTHRFFLLTDEEVRDMILPRII